MIDKEKLAAIKSSMAAGEVVRDPLLDMSEADLRRLRADIDRVLPDDNLKSLNLENELVKQYIKTRDLMDETIISEDTPANQKAQVANSVVSTLGQLVKLQEDLRRQQTLSIMESVLVDSLKALTEEARDAFYVEYERLAKKAGLM